MKQWHGIFRIIEADIFDSDGKSIWHVEDLKNTIHKEGAYYILNRTLNTSLGASAFYFGLDNRLNLLYENTYQDLWEEPSGNGYVRFSVSPSNQFVQAPSTQSTAELISPNLIFLCNNNSWGPVSNLFVSTSTNAGVLLSSVKLTQPITLSTGQSFVVRMGMSLFNC